MLVLFGERKARWTTVVEVVSTACGFHDAQRRSLLVSRVEVIEERGDHGLGNGRFVPRGGGVFGAIDIDDEEVVDVESDADVQAPLQIDPPSVAFFEVLKLASGILARRLQRYGVEVLKKIVQNFDVLFLPPNPFGLVPVHGRRTHEAPARGADYIACVYCVWQ